MFFLPGFLLKKNDNTIPTYTTHKHINLIEIPNIYEKVNVEDNEQNSEVINAEKPVEENGIEAEKTVENMEDVDVKLAEDIAGIVNMQLEEKSSIDEDGKTSNDAVEDVDDEESDEDEDEKSQEISDSKSEQVIEENKGTDEVDSAGAEEKDENLTVSTEIDDDKKDAAESVVEGETEIHTTHTETQAKDLFTNSDNIETAKSENHDENDNDIDDANIEGVDKELIDEKEHEEIIEEV